MKLLEYVHALEDPQFDLAYPPRPLAIGRWNVHWLVAFIVLLFAWTLALVKPMRVQL